MAVMILSGSGLVDRDGNLPRARYDSLKLLARALADVGIASLRVDKRGIGESRSPELREADLRVGTYVADAVAWLGFLTDQAPGSRLALIGHSEGALVATLVAQQADVSAIVLVAGAGWPAAQVIDRQLAAAGSSVAILRESRRITAALTAGQDDVEVSPELEPLYRRSVQPYLSSWFRVDPAAELAKLDCRVLIIQGTHDLQIGTADARHLAASCPQATMRLIDGMNHVLKIAPANRSGQRDSYDDADLPLADGLVSAIVSFLTPP